MSGDFGELRVLNLQHWDLRIQEHLHFKIREIWSGRPLNPALFLQVEDERAYSAKGEWEMIPIRV